MAGASIETREPEADLLVFHEIARALTSSLDLESILGTIMRQMQSFFQPESWTLLLADERRRDLYYAVTDGRFSAQFAGTRFAYGEGMAGWVAERGETLIVPEISAADRSRFGGDPLLSADIRSAICLPLRSRLRTLGVMQLFNLPPAALTDYAVSFLLVLCDFAAIAIENARTFERVQELTILDECTGLYNLRHFEQTLQSEIIRCERLNSPMSLIFIDLDHFKLVNDHYGHQAGSHLLAAVSATMKAQVRSIDLAFRYGGDEFLVLLPGIGKAAAAQVANRLLRALHQEHALPGNLSLRVTASLGVASYPEDGTTGEEILHAADARMYLVKGESRDGVAFVGGEHALNHRA